MKSCFSFLSQKNACDDGFSAIRRYQKDSDQIVLRESVEHGRLASPSAPSARRQSQEDLVWSLAERATTLCRFSMHQAGSEDDRIFCHACSASFEHHIGDRIVAAFSHCLIMIITLESLGFLVRL